MSAQNDLERQEVKRLIMMMKDPRYWRDHDPEVLHSVRAGFKRLYGPPKGTEPPMAAERPAA